MAIQPAARLLQTLKHWVGDGSSAPLGPQSIRLDPRSQLALLDRRAALWSGKNPLRILKQSSGHNHLVAGASTWAAVSTSSQEALRPPPTWFRCGLCLGDSMSQAPSSSPHSLGYAHKGNVWTCSLHRNSARQLPSPPPKQPGTIQTQCRLSLAPLGHRCSLFCQLLEAIQPLWASRLRPVSW